MFLRPIPRQIRRDGAHLVFPPSTAVFPLFFAGLNPTAIHPDHQQRRRIQRHGRSSSAFIRHHFRIASQRQYGADRLRPTLNLLAIQSRAPVFVQRLRRLIERLHRSFPRHPASRTRREQHLRRQTPITDLRGKKFPRKPGTARTASITRLDHEGTTVPMNARPSSDIPEPIHKTDIAPPKGPLHSCPTPPAPPTPPAGPSEPTAPLGPRSRRRSPPSTGPPHPEESSGLTQPPPRLESLPEPPDVSCVPA